MKLKNLNLFYAEESYSYYHQDSAFNNWCLSSLSEEDFLKYLRNFLVKNNKLSLTMEDCHKAVEGFYYEKLSDMEVDLLDKKTFLLYGESSSWYIPDFSHRRDIFRYEVMDYNPEDILSSQEKKEIKKQIILMEKEKKEQEKKAQALALKREKSRKAKERRDKEKEKLLKDLSKKLSQEELKNLLKD